MTTIMLIGYALIQYSLAQPVPPYKAHSRLKAAERSEIDKKCEKFGGESYTKCLELEKKKIEDKHKKDEKK